MSQKIDNLRTILQTKLNAISDQLNTVKTHLETYSKEVESSIHTKLDTAKAKLAAKKQEILNAKTKLAERVEAKETEIEEWKAKREHEKLVARADRAEDYAATAIIIALAAVEEAEIAILEAVAARIDAETD
jgi:hypothetical protein